MNKQYVADQLALINNYLNLIAAELNNPECHEYYIHDYAFRGLNRFKAILNESKGVVKENVEDENKGMVEHVESEQKEVDLNGGGTESNVVGTTEDNQPTNEVHGDSGEPIGDNGECDLGEGREAGC